MYTCDKKFGSRITPRNSHPLFRFSHGKSGSTILISPCDSLGKIFITSIRMEVIKIKNVKGLQVLGLQIEIR